MAFVETVGTTVANTVVEASDFEATVDASFSESAKMQTEGCRTLATLAEILAMDAAAYARIAEAAGVEA